MSLWYAVCSTGCGLIIGRCFGACNGATCSCAEERQTAIKQINEAFIWLSGLCIIDKENY